MHRAQELLQIRPPGDVALIVVVVRLVSVGAPEPFQLAGVGVDHGHSPVAITIGEIHFVRRSVKGDLGDTAEAVETQAVAAPAGHADLQQEVAASCELERV